MKIWQIINWLKYLALRNLRLNTLSWTIRSDTTCPTNVSIPYSVLSTNLRIRLSLLNVLNLEDRFNHWPRLPRRLGFIEANCVDRLAHHVNITGVILKNEPHKGQVSLLA